MPDTTTDAARAMVARRWAPQSRVRSAIAELERNADALTGADRDALRELAEPAQTGSER